MTLVKERPKSRTFAWREEIRYLSVRRPAVERPETEVSAELPDIGSVGGPVVPREWIRTISR